MSGADVSILGRRAFLQRLGLTAAAAPLAAKEVIDSTIARQAGVGTEGLGFAPPMTAGGAPNQPGGTNSNFRLHEHIAGLLRDQTHHDAYTSLLYQQRRYISILDVDLANKRSFSMAAKVTFQRQRDVARQMREDHEGVQMWDRPADYVRKAVGFGFKFPL